MIDKLAIIRQILETDEETDKKILSLLESAGKTAGPEVKKIKAKAIHIEERESPRKAVVLDADINTGTERIHACAQDVSLSGAYICMEKKIARGEDIAIRLISPDGEEFSFISQVARVNSTGIGVLIKTISNVHQEKFEKFVRKL